MPHKKIRKVTKKVKRKKTAGRAKRRARARKKRKRREKAKRLARKTGVPQRVQQAREHAAETKSEAAALKDEVATTHTAKQLRKARSAVQVDGGGEPRQGSPMDVVEEENNVSPVNLFPGPDAEDQPPRDNFDVDLGGIDSDLDNIDDDLDFGKL